MTLTSHRQEPLPMPEKGGSFVAAGRRHAHYGSRAGLGRRCKRNSITLCGRLEYLSRRRRRKPTTGTTEGREMKKNNHRPPPPLGILEGRLTTPSTSTAMGESPGVVSVRPSPRSRSWTSDRTFKQTLDGYFVLPARLVIGRAESSSGSASSDGRSTTLKTGSTQLSARGHCGALGT